jgi:predicted peroxiredoxin
MLGFLLARTAAEEGHKVEIFLSGDGVQLVRDTIIENLVGLGTGKLKEHMDILKKNVFQYMFPLCHAKIEE